MSGEPPQRDGESGAADEKPGSKIAERYRYKRMGVAYQGAMESVFAIAISMAAGYWADDYFGTRPWLLAGGATIGFAAFVLRLTRLGAALNRAASDEEPLEKDPEALGGPRKEQQEQKPGPSRESSQNR